jgi:hypothetical protein
MVTTVTSRVLTRIYALVTIATNVSGFSSVKSTFVWRETRVKGVQDATEGDCQIRHVHPTVTMQQLDSRWKQFDKISHWGYFAAIDLILILLQSI